MSGTRDGDEDLLLFFRILMSLAPIRSASAENTRHFSPISVTNDEEIAAIGHAE